MPGDLEIGAALGAASGLPVDEQDWVLEGGGIDVDGTGLAVTTEECLLHPHRNPSLTREDLAVPPHQSLGLERLLWLGKAPLGDNNAGHVSYPTPFTGEGMIPPTSSAGGAH